MPNFTVKHLKIFFLLVSIHSLFVGLGLILIPSHFFIEFGYNEIGENFFRVQGGTFHLVMVAAYLLAAVDPAKNRIMVIFSIIAKTMATIFLFAYFLLFDSIIVVLLSGIVDLGMGVIIYLLAKISGLFNDRN